MRDRGLARQIAPSPYRALVAFIIERESVRVKKEGGNRPPYTGDPYGGASASGGMLSTRYGTRSPRS
jgi:hypothetical protein